MKTIRVAWVLVAALFLTPVPAPAQSQPDLKAALAAAAPQWLAQYRVPSVAVAYVEDGRIAWTAVYGLQSPGVSATDETLYNIASLTKPITAEIVLRLASAGKLELDEPMYPYWVDPDIASNPWSKLLTPRICLTHETGFPNWRRMTNGVLTFKWEPGTNTGYSGEGYEYVSRFVQHKLGADFFTTLAGQYVFGPIGMEETSYVERSWFTGHLSIPYGSDGKPGPPEVTEQGNAADLIRTTTRDYARFLISVMNDDMLTPQIAMQRQMIARDELTVDQEQALCKLENLNPNACMVASGMGLGWAIFKGSETVLWHDGSDWGVRTLALIVPARKFGLVIFTNGDSGKPLIREALDMLYPNPAFATSMEL